MKLTRYIATLLTALIVGSCSTTEVAKQGGTLSDFQKQIGTLNALLVENPRNAGGLRDLGIIHYQVRLYREALGYLKRSYDIDPDDPRQLFYHGMVLEELGNPQAALGIYLSYTEAPSGSGYKSLLEGRYRALTRDAIQNQIRERVAGEQQLNDGEMAEGTIAVFPLAYQGKEQKYEAIGYGLGELIVTDLGKVSKLKAVERLRMDALQQELALGQTGRVDPATAPRVGKLLKAGRIVSGTYDVSSAQVLRLDYSLANAVKKRFPDPQSKSDDLENLFRVEKDIVFELVKNMGITLTRAEREDIERVPTKNLQAFILYSIGLEKESQRDFRTAASYYGQAAELDPSFEQAKTKASANSALAVAGNPGDALQAAELINPPFSADGPDLVQKRLQNLGNMTGSSFFPGEDHRESVEEAARAGAAVRDLPGPPPPPRP